MEVEVEDIMWSAQEGWVRGKGFVWCSGLFVSRFGRLLALIIIWLIKQKVGSQFFVLVAREVCLNDEIALETKAAKLKGRISMHSNFLSGTFNLPSLWPHSPPL